MLFDYYHSISFGWPQALWFALVVPVLLVWYIVRSGVAQAGVKVSSSKRFADLSSLKNLLRHIPFVLRMFCLLFFIIALARPHIKNERQEFQGEGVDIVLCIDISGSMMAQDFTPNRIEAAKKVAEDFVNSRTDDRIGVVIFSGESFTQCPLTTDRDVLMASINGIHTGLLDDGTAIGEGLATGVDRLRNSKTKSKVIILLTDGINNGGLIDPITARDIAKTFGIKVYTIGVGTEGVAPFPVNTPEGVIMEQQKVEIDEDLLKDIATETGGKYYRATNNAVLSNIYKDINGLEKSKIQSTTYTSYNEKYFPFVMIALACLLLEVVLRFTYLKKFP
jgi:Ca-activated chloride channel family protein